MLKGKNVLLGVTGSIAAYKIADLASRLKKLSCNVDVIMTENACHFIHPITFETLTGNKCIVNTFDRNFQYQVEHVALAKKADLMLVAPASANFIGKAACGIADDMLTTTFMACRCKKMVAPAMNTNMYHNPVVLENLDRLRRFETEVIAPDNGYLACGDTGEGKMPAPEVLLSYILRELACEKDMTGRRVLVTAGATREAIDPVRYLTNYSSGKMGYAIAKNAMLRGADVTLISGETALSDVPFVRMVRVQSARDMYEAVMNAAPACDMIVKAAAVADYRPQTVSDQKIKKKDGEFSIRLERTDDILAALGKNKRAGQFLCGFSMETENLITHSREKLEKKNLDMIVANNVKVAGVGFGTDTNVVTLITKHSCVELPLMRKEEAAARIFDYILEKAAEMRKNESEKD